MNCPRCGKGIPNGAAFCMHCGASLVPAGPVPTHQPVAHPQAAQYPTHPPMGGPTAGIPAAFAQQQKKRNALAIGIGTLLALIAIGLGAKGFLQLRGQQEGGNGLRATGLVNNADLTKAGQIAAPDLTKTGTMAPPDLTRGAEKIEMPREVWDWLEHLRRTEEARVAIVTGQVADAAVEKTKQSVTGGVDALKGMMDNMDNPDAVDKPPTEGLVKMFRGMQRGAEELSIKFDNVPAPEECKPIQSAYDQAIHETTAEIGDIAAKLEANDLHGLYAMVGKSKATVDKPGKRTDDLVQQICDKYQTRKWFSIAGDIGSASNLTIPGGF